MAKRKNDFTSLAEDYVSQLNWRAKHPGIRRGGASSGWPEPKWNYRIAYRYPPTLLFEKMMRVVLPLCVIIGTVFIIFSDLFTIELKIFSVSMVALFIAIVFFAIRDATKDDVSKHLD